MIGVGNRRVFTVDWYRLSTQQQTRVMILFRERTRETGNVMNFGLILEEIVENGIAIRAAETTGEITSNIKWFL